MKINWVVSLERVFILILGNQFCLKLTNKLIFGLLTTRTSKIDLMSNLITLLEVVVVCLLLFRIYSSYNVFRGINNFRSKTHFWKFDIFWPWWNQFWPNPKIDLSPFYRACLGSTIAFCRAAKVRGSWDREERLSSHQPPAGSRLVRTAVIARVKEELRPRITLRS